MSDAKDSLLQFFKSNHLPEKLRNISQPFEIMAQMIYKDCPRNSERTVALRKLLEAKDCAVRSLLYSDTFAYIPDEVKSEPQRQD